MESLDSNQMARHLWQFCQQEQIEFELFSYSLQQAYLPLLTNIYAHYQQSKEKPFVVGINAAQGAGKTTLAKLLALLLENCFGLNVVRFSIDDLYYSKQQRKNLSETIHPLLETRGVPGTHDVQLGIKIFESLKRSDFSSPVLIPRFDKSTDDLKPRSDWTCVDRKPQIILFEGWCVGSTPQAPEQLAVPLNHLEENLDNNRVWRNYVNDCLSGEYQDLFSVIDYLVFLKAPNFETVFNWRLEQEKKLELQIQTRSQGSGKSAASHIMDAESINNFIMYFERLTRHNLETLSEKSNIVLTLNQYRSPKSLI